MELKVGYLVGKQVNLCGQWVIRYEMIELERNNGIQCFYFLDKENKVKCLFNIMLLIIKSYLNLDFYFMIFFIEYLDLLVYIWI